MKEDQKFINGIAVGDRIVIREIYAKYFSKITKYILSNKGTIEDAKDIFQDALMILYKKSKDPNFQLNYGFYTYLYGICKNTWLNKLRKKTIKGVPFEDNMELIDNSNYENEIEWRAKERLFRSKFALLDDRCRQILELFMAGYSMELIARKLNISSGAYAKKRKYKCKGKLIEMIKKDSSYTDLIKA